ncbi:hypothetical protein CHUAL_012688 [Chamberlinius hualienensis]
MFKVANLFFREWAKRFGSNLMKRSSGGSVVPAFPLHQNRTKLALSYVGILTYLGIRKSMADEKRDKTTTTVKMALLAQQEGKMEVAEKLLHVALRLAQEQIDTNAETYIYDAMGNLALEVQDYEKAMKLFKQVALRLVNRGTHLDDDAMIDISLKLAEIYSNLLEHEKAESGFDYCFKILHSKIATGKATKDQKLLMSKTSNSFAKHLMNRQMFERAMHYFKIGYEISEKENGRVHPQTVILMNDLATCYSKIGDHMQALEYLKQAIDIAKENNYMELSCYYTNLAQLLLLTEEYTEAERYCIKAYECATTKEQKKEANGCTRLVKDMKNVLVKV